MNLEELKEQKRNLELRLDDINNEIEKIKNQSLLDRYNLAIGDIIECNGIKGQVYKVQDDWCIYVKEIKKDGTIGNRERIIYVCNLDKGITKL